jgi:GNAT superfamily N-acetyltransferase
MISAARLVLAPPRAADADAVFERYDSDPDVTGYVLAKDAWGQGYATEALGAMVDVARRINLRRIYALCHPQHQASWRVLEKCGFSRDRTWSTREPQPRVP